MTKDQMAQAHELLGEPSDLRIVRDGDRDIQSKGWKIGEGDSRDHLGHGTPRSDANRWTTITIYLTTGGNLLARIVRRTRWQGERDRDDAKVCRTPAEALAFLCEGGDLGGASKDAWEMACQEWPPLAAEECEVVE